MAFKLHRITFDEEINNKALNFKELIDIDLLFTLIIGANGTGKSVILSKIIEIFKDLEDKKNSQVSNRTVLKFYNISYSLNHEKFNITKNKSTYILENDKSEAISWSDVILPSRVLALSFLVEDKFTFQSEANNNESSMYKYLGIRSTANASFLGSVNKKMNAIIYENIHNTQFCDNVVSTLELLGYEPEIKIKFEYNMPRLVKQKLTKKTINTRIQALKKTSSYINKELYKVSEDDKSDIINYIEKIKKIRSNKSESKVFTQFEIDFRDIKLAYNELKIARKMVLLELLKSPKFHMKKEKSHIDFSRLSSGEKNLIFITLNIIAHATDNSLIIIDEPEVSLHPNWQIVYNMHLKKILSTFTNNHVIIATHSHFMVSGLSQEESTILTINSKQNIERIVDNTYSWSAENVLYKVFNTRTVNNTYIEDDLKEILQLISIGDKKNIIQVQEIYNRLRLIVFDKADPLNIVLEKIEKYLDER